MTKKRYSVVIERATGNPVSFCTAGKEASADVLERKGYEVVDLGEHEEPGPDMGKLRFDKATRRLVERVTRDRLDDIEADAEQFPELSRILRGSGRTKLRDELGRLLGSMRHRQEDEGITLG